MSLIEKKKKIESKEQKNLFDHLNAIRITKDPNYYDSLSEEDKKNFNHWAILNGLSMDPEMIEIVSFLWQDGYFNKIPSKQFYRLLLDIIPRTNKKLCWIKKSKSKNKDMKKIISDWYSISYREASDYIKLFMSTNEGILELIKILKGVGLDEKEVEKIFKI